jgi:hypothetical protein
MSGDTTILRGAIRSVDNDWQRGEVEASLDSPYAADIRRAYDEQIPLHLGGKAFYVTAYGVAPYADSDLAAQSQGEIPASCCATWDDERPLD